MPPAGSLALVLHAHLPFIRHPEYPDFLEEDWFFEASAETYLPLLRRFDRLRSENVPFRLTMSVTPPLASMMEDDLLINRLEHYLDQRIALLEMEAANNEEGPVAAISRHYLEEFTANRAFLRGLGGRMLRSFRSLYESGHLEIITCTATHGLLPLMERSSSLQAQVRTAVRSHEHHFGRKPRGIWLAECGYDARVDGILADAGIEYFFVDTHGLLFGEPHPAHGVYAPVVTEAGVSAFARDPESSKQVWSQQEGYPGDEWYREFYRDLGYDADYDYIKPFLHADGVRRGVGIKYHRITGSGVDLREKAFYDPQRATGKAADHAGNFMHNRQLQIQWLKGKTHAPPIIVAPYDAELFGHWWYEGPQFLEFLIRKIAFDQSDIELISPVDHIDRHPVRQLQKPNPSTWGSEGHNLVWLYGGNAWIYRHQHWAEAKMEELAVRFSKADGWLRRGLNQLLRELLMLQSSDWAFILTTGTAVPYATKRFRQHLDNFRRIADEIEGDRLDTDFLRYLEGRLPIFPSADFHDAIPVGAARIISHT